jgi:hypothetical protein
MPGTRPGMTEKASRQTNWKALSVIDPRILARGVHIAATVLAAGTVDRETHCRARNRRTVRA